MARIEAFGNSYFYHPGGIDVRPIDPEQRGENSRVIELGETERTQEELMQYLKSFPVRRRFAEGKYNLRSNNSNHFADDICRNFFQVTEAVPEPLLNQTAAVGRTVKGFVEQARQAFSAAVNEGFEEVGEEIEKMIELGAEDPTEEEGEDGEGQGEAQGEKKQAFVKPKKGAQFAKPPGKQGAVGDSKGASVVIIDGDEEDDEEDPQDVKKPVSRGQQQRHCNPPRRAQGRRNPQMGRHQAGGPRRGNEPTLEIEVSLGKSKEIGAERRCCVRPLAPEC